MLGKQLTSCANRLATAGTTNVLAHSPRCVQTRGFLSTPRQDGMISTLGTVGILGVLATPALPPAGPFPGGSVLMDKYLPKSEHRVLAWIGGMAPFGTMASMGGAKPAKETKTQKESRELAEVIAMCAEVGPGAAEGLTVEGLETVHTDTAPAAIGPYCQGIKCGGMVYMSGAIAMDPKTGNIADAIKGDVEAQTAQAMRNVDQVLLAAGTSKNHVVKATVFVTDLADFARVNKVYAEYFGHHKPARSCVQVAALPKGALVEVEVTAKL